VKDQRQIKQKLMKINVNSKYITGW